MLRFIWSFLDWKYTMPALASFTSSDWGALGVTPVTHTFLPLQTFADGTVAYSEAGATPLDDLKATIWKRTTSENGRIKMTVKIERPVTATQTINGVSSPTVLRKAYAELTVTAESSSTPQERGDILALICGALQATDPGFVIFKDNSFLY
jgi:hypothetical protein